MDDGHFDFDDALSGDKVGFSIRAIGPGVNLIAVVTGNDGKHKATFDVMLPTDVAAEIGKTLISPPVSTLMADVTAVLAELEQLTPANVMDRDEGGELDDDALDDGLWIALLGSGVSQERLSAFPEGVRAFYATRLIEWEIGNGVFQQAIHNAADCFDEAIAGYTLLGDDASADLFRRALQSRSDAAALDALDEEVDGAPWGGVPWGDARRLAYVRAHRDEFRL